ncbi:hypothetical protein [Mesoflavibacter zeaxanthinifaciens]|uniref:hypothetical protein n=1 Tax=Mesoflavibacter zeaxanthinifaciens TaxID=393060 RepID=UPI000418107F|nr:hypothetical protein [Mesoflavibacter zeaxanthinifaciens]
MNNKTLDEVKESVKTEYKNKIKLTDKVSNVDCIKFNMSQIDNNKNLNKILINKISNLDNSKPYVYIFEFLNLSDSSFSIRDNFIKTKKINKYNRNFTQVNSKADIKSKILYIGSVKNKISTRFKQHLGVLAGTTGALHLSYWMDKNLDLKFTYIEIPNITMTNDFEAALRKQLTPLLGQK